MQIRMWKTMLPVDKHQLLLLLPKGSLDKVKTVDNLTGHTTCQSIGYKTDSEVEGQVKSQCM